VERRVDRSPRGVLPLRQPLHDLLECERVVTEVAGNLLDVVQRRPGRLVVAVVRRRLTEASLSVVLELDPDDLGNLGRVACDDERLRELELHDPGREPHC
jgi:hypothetical protein